MTMASRNGSGSSSFITAEAKRLCQKNVFTILCICLTLLFCYSKQCGAPRVSSQAREKSAVSPALNGTAPKIFVFYHAFCTEISFPIIQDQMLRLVFSSLYAKATIHATLTGKSRHVDKVALLIRDLAPKIIMRIAKNDNSSERITILSIRTLISPNDKVLYLHSKGATRPDLTKTVFYWRTFMEYFLIAQNEVCINYLDEYDVVGVDYFTSTKLCRLLSSKLCNQVPPHFSGNFWWARGAYLLSLPTKISEAYGGPEFYLFLKDPKFKSLHPHNPNIDLYNDRKYPALYLDDGLREIDALEQKKKETQCDQPHSLPH